MFDFAWTEIALIGVVALVLIGPKDMPVAVKAVANVVKKARRMAAEFQGQVDEMVRDTELADVRKQINEIRNFDIRGEIERAVDEDGSLRKSFDDPFAASPLATPPAASDAPAGDAPADGALPEVDLPAPPAPRMIGALIDPEAPAVPAFIPPEVAAAAAAPAFIPPNAAQASFRRAPFA